MPGDAKPLGIAAICAGVRDGPRHCRRAVLDERRIADLRHQPVIGHDNDESLCRDGAGGEAVVLAAAVRPAAAVEEHHHRSAVRALGRIDVELLARVGAEGDVVRHPVGPAVAGSDGVESVERIEARAGGQHCGKCRAEREEQAASKRHGGLS